MASLHSFRKRLSNLLNFDSGRRRKSRLQLQLLESRIAPALFQGLGELVGGQVGSRADAISANGSVIVGESYSTQGLEAYRWDSGSGIIGIGDLPGGGFSSGATDASYDGSVIVGDGYSSNSSQEAYRWTAGSGMVGLGDLVGGIFQSKATAVSDDGQIIVGFGFGTTREAFRWTQDSGMTGLGDLPGGTVSSEAYGISANGAVIVGNSNSTNGVEAFRWTSMTEMVGLGDLPGSTFYSSASAVSADGSVIVGRSRSANSGTNPEAFRWTAGSGLVGLGDLPGSTFSSVPNALSADGSVIVGTANYNGGTNRLAFIWTPIDGMRSLRDVLVGDYGLANELMGWTLHEATGCSADGRTIVGYGINPAGKGEAWRAQIEPILPDIAVLSASIKNATEIQVSFNTSLNPSPFQFGVYRSNDQKFDVYDLQIGGPQLVTPGPVGGVQSVLLSLAQALDFDPLRPYTLIVADPLHQINESNELNNQAIIAQRNLRVNWAMTDDSRQTKCEIEILGDLPLSLNVSVFRSSRAVISPTTINTANQGTEILISQKTIPVLSTGKFQDVLVGDLTINPIHNFVHVVIDAQNQITETDETDNVRSFRKHVVGVVTHGFTVPVPSWERSTRPSWVSDLANSLKKKRGYDHAFPFFWSQQSNAWQSGMAVAAGQALSSSIRALVTNILAANPGDIVDLHLVGHSRGAVVISQALQFLQQDSIVGVQVRQGFVRMTMIDPHSANNSWNPQFSASMFATLQNLVVAFQAIANDPQPFFPESTDQSEVFFQQSLWWMASSTTVLLTGLNLWGQNGLTLANYSGRPLSANTNLTGQGIDHSSIVDWYRRKSEDPNWIP